MRPSAIRRRIAVAAYIFTIAFVVAHTINAVVANALFPPPDYHPPVPDPTELTTSADTPQQLTEGILHSGLFPLPQTLNSESEDLNPSPPRMLDAAKKVALFGTVFGREGGVMAVLEDIATKKQSLYRLGSQVPNVGVLAAIEKDRVLFREDQTEEWLTSALAQRVSAGMPGSSLSATAQTLPTSQRLVLDRRALTEALNDTTRLLMQAQAVPYLNNGKLDGLRLYGVMPLGFFDKMGLRTNDIVQRINGVELQNPGMLLSLFQQLRDERGVRVELVRDSQRQTLNYEIR